MCCGKSRQQFLRTPLTSPTTRSGSFPASPANRPMAGARGQSMPNPLHSAQPAVAPIQRPGSTVALRYLQRSPIRVQGPVTGRHYDFSGSQPVQSVDSRDATALVRTRFFQQD